MSSIQRILLLALALAAGLPPAGAGAAQQEAVLGTNGDLFVVQTGTYGKLFPGGTEADPNAAVLALDVVRPAAEKERLLVRGTEGPEVEGVPSLFFEESSHTVFLLWESRINRIHPFLVLSGFDGAAWIEPIQILGSPFTTKSSPHFTVTRDSYQAAGADGKPATRQRTIVHVVWGEESSSGWVETFYTPVIFENGVLFGRGPILRLNDYDTATAPATAFETAPALVGSARIQPGHDGRTVVVGFASATTRRLTTLEIDVLPAQLAALADKARSHIIDIGAHYTPGSRPQLNEIADKARSHIIDIGVAFYPELAQSFAEQVHKLLLANPADGIAALGDKARSHIIDIGAKLSGRGLKPQVAAPLSTPTAATAETREIVLPRPAGAPADSPAPLLRFRVASSRPAPRVGAAAAVDLFLSESGTDVLIAWQEDSLRVLYRDSKANGWNDIREIPLVNGIDLAGAYEILARRVRNR